MSTGAPDGGHERLLRALSMLFLLWLLGLLGVVAAVESLARWQWELAVALEAALSVVLLAGLLVLRHLRRAADRSEA
jgi:membrane protein implicated in regulation of membrane protease activity